MARRDHQLLRLTLFGLPELDLVPPERLDAVLAETARAPGRRLVIGSALMIIPVLTVMLIVVKGLERWQPGAQLASIVFGAAFIVTFYLAMRLLHVQMMRPGLRRAIDRLGIPICLTCGYGLQGTTDEQCPECGTTASRHGAE